MTSHAESSVELPPSSAIAWLDVSAETWAGRPRTGPLGMQLTASANPVTPFAFHGARLRGVRCVWAAATVSGAELSRPSRVVLPANAESSVHLLARIAAAGSVFDPSAASVGTLSVLRPTDEVVERFDTTTHLFTLNVPIGTLGVEAATLRGLYGNTYDLSLMQARLFRAATTLLVDTEHEFGDSATLSGVDRYLASLAALVLRTATTHSAGDGAHVDQLRRRTDEIINEQSGDPDLTPAVIAAQLGISLRQLYRAFSDTESPAARIRRSRLERAANILAKRTGPGEVERVAIECGFVSAEYFSRAFRREFGLSPRAYRSANRKAVAR